MNKKKCNILTAMCNMVLKKGDASIDVVQVMYCEIVSIGFLN